MNLADMSPHIKLEDSEVMVQVVGPSTPSVRTDAGGGGGGGGGGVTAVGVGVGDVLELSPHPNVTAIAITATNAGMCFIGDVSSSSIWPWRA